MPQNTNLNVSPYFDDFKRSNNYNRVLFKPATPIQARELTTLQSILQDQIEQFGNHFFKDGSVVIPGQIAYESEYTSVQINDTFSGIPVSSYIDNLIGITLKGEISGVTAKVEYYYSPLEDNVSNYTLFVKYQSSSDTNFTTKTFVDGENLITLEDINYSLSTIRANSSIVTSVIQNSTSVGSAAKIADGVYFIRGFFVFVPSQIIILDPYTNTPSYRVGLLINEEIAIASNEYPDLFDNANGFSNYAADGADRLKITATLIKKSITDFNDQDFIELLRIENGAIQKFVKDTQYNIIEDEIARRTYDQSGDYYVRPFSISIKESLNNRTGNDGIYNDNQQTKQGNLPSKNLACLSISPGKAYVRGYEIETINTTTIDVEKPRDTEEIYNEFSPFNIGKQIEINNIFGTAPIGFGTNSQVKLYSGRTQTPGVSSGIEIGIARIYDLSFDTSNYVDASTSMRCSLYDIQTYTVLSINSTITQSTPAFIRGSNSGATGYLLNNVTDSNQLTLYQVSGSFVANEQISGLNEIRTITNVTDYNLSDVHQISNAENIFTADPVLSNNLYIADTTTQFTISAENSGISAISASASNFYVNLKVGDIIKYTKPGQTVPTYNKVQSINPSLNTINVVATTSVSNVCDGSLPNSTIPTINGVTKATLSILNTSNAFLYSNLKYSNISNLDLTSSEILIKKSYEISISSNSYSSTLETDTNLTLEPFSIENYNLAEKYGGIVEQLNDQKLTVSGRTITLQNLNISSGQAILTVTYKKNKCSTRKKIYNRCEKITINNSSSNLSGIGASTLNDGLIYSSIYGTRVQDEQISLNVCDVESVLAVYQSSTTDEPSLPKLNLVNTSSNLLNTIIGERVIGSNSNAVAVVSDNKITNQIEIVYINENKFIPNEEILFEESKVTSIVYSIEIGDFDIKKSFTFDNGQRSEFLDFSRIIRNNNASSPNRQLKIIYNYYSIDKTDGGDFVSATSYDSIRYENNIASINGSRVTDIIDVRPRVLPYTGNKSPFEYYSRIFSPDQNSSPNTFANNRNINLSYSYYLPRIDKLFLTKEGTFALNKGISSLTPKVPDGLNNALEIATIYYPAYLYNVNDAKIVVSSHKRYTMKDISTLEDRISNVEYYTSLSLLETDTQNLTIRDPQTQLDKFKCGFFVDNFRSIYGGDISNENYRASIDVSNGFLRPEPYATSLDLLLGSESIVGVGTTANPTIDINYVNDLGSNNIKKVGNVICLNYNDVEYTKNKFATRSENVNPFNTINWIGSIKLNPESDTWVDPRKTERTIDVEGSYNATIQQYSVDTNTGLSPVDWGSWETNWSGSSTSSGPVLGQLNQSSVVSDTGWVATSALHASRAPDGVMRQSQVSTQAIRDTVTTFSSETTTTTTNQTRQGIQYAVSSKYDTTKIGDRVVSAEIITTMRSRNIEIISRRLKPKTKFYAFFDNVDVTSYVFPKLLEVTMVSGNFNEFETVIGKLGTKSIQFRLAKQNHKYGPYNQPTEVYTENPYEPSNYLSGSYSPTTTILNVDISSLGIQSISDFFGYVSVGMKLVGQKSGAVATISDLRLISDSSGTLISSFFIPDPTLPSTPSFQTGTKTFLLTTSSTNSSIVGISESSAETNFVSSGTLENVESSTLRIKNASIERNTVSDQRTTTSTDSRIVANTQNSFRSSSQTRWVDPLAESFEVTDPNGVFITKCDIFFRSKDDKLPVTIQIRTMQNGTPTQTILPFSEVILDPNNIFTSSDGSIPTTFTFSSPVYLETGNSYAIVLLSASNNYNVWISRMGEVDITTVNKPDSEKIIVSQQPVLGSLFKSQNGSTWDPSQLEDLKFTLYRADFTTSSASVRFYNPELGIGNNQIASLIPNPVSCYSKSILVGFGNTLTNLNLSNLIVGNNITQQNNSNFSGNLKSIVGAIGINSTLIITNSGNDFSVIGKTYSNISLISLSGNGNGAKVNLTVNNGVAIAATVSIGGSGYSYGDALTVSPSDTDGFGKNLIISIPNTVGVISAYNSLLIDNVQGRLNINLTDNIISTNSTGNQVITGAVVSIINQSTDGLHFKVFHQNHGMYNGLNVIKILGIESDISPTTLKSNYSSTTNNSISVNSVDNFVNFENIPVSNLNPGYILINDEIISYTSVDSVSNLLTGTVFRGVDNTIPSSHDLNDLVFKYEFDGVSLRRINTSHSLSNTNLMTYPIEIDSYYLKIDTSKNGVDRTYGNSNNYPELFFKSKKTGGSYLTSNPQSSSLNGPKSTQNITFNIVKPIVQTILPETTSITSKLRTVSGTSIDGNETPYLDQGFQNITFNSNNILETTRSVLSQVNEDTYLNSSTFPGKKSLTLEMILSTKDSKVSPMIDLDRVNMIFVMNRINNPVSDFSKDPRVNKLIGDPNSAVYISKKIKLQKSANSLKVLFDAYRHSSNDIRVLYRLFRNDTPDDQQLYELFPGYDNLDVSGNVINSANNSGRSDKFISSSTNPNDFGNYEFNAKNLSLFNGYQIKIIMTGTNQTFTPKIRDLRAIASI